MAGEVIQIRTEPAAGSLQTSSQSTKKPPKNIPSSVSEVGKEIVSLEVNRTWIETASITPQPKFTQHNPVTGELYKSGRLNLAPKRGEKREATQVPLQNLNERPDSSKKRLHFIFKAKPAVFIWASPLNIAMHQLTICWYGDIVLDSYE